MKEILINHFSKIQILTDQEKDAIRNSIEILSLKKGDTLLKAGQIARSNYFVLKGCVRQFYLKDGSENTSNFFIEEEWILPSLGMEEDRAVSYSLECLEDCHLVVGDEKRGDELIRDFPQFQMIAQLTLEKEIIRQQTKMANYINNTPEERYMQLQKNQFDLLNRIPQYYLSSYIGVKPESLSRIRKRIAKKG